MAIKKILLVASFLLLLLSTHANTAYFKHLSVQDGLSQVNIISIYQDETGALWLVLLKESIDIMASPSLYFTLPKTT